MDDAVRYAEEHIGGVSIGEVLWGGPRGEGLTFTVARLASTVETLAATQAMQATQINGADGVKAGIKILETKIDDETAAIKARLDAKDARDKVMGTITVAIFAPCAVAFILRLAYVLASPLWTGHLG